MVERRPTRAPTLNQSAPSGPPTCSLVAGSSCLGRRTEGIEDCLRSRAPTLGEVFAGRAYLEEVSVHAFARLERELAAHGAPTELLREARRARRDEVRHTAMMTRLARRFGRSVSPPRPPVATPVRSLFEIALENAVEGCVRGDLRRSDGARRSAAVDRRGRASRDRIASGRTNAATPSLRGPWPGGSCQGSPRQSSKP